MVKAHAFGQLLAKLRRQRGRSQLQVACDAAVSPKHISFLETGRSLPTRPMVLRLASAIELSGELRDQLLLAAGFVPAVLPIDICSTRTCSSVAENALEQALLIQDAATVADATQRAGKALEAFGLVHFFAGVLTPPTARASLEIQIREGGRPPVGWLAHYEEQRYRDFDPLVHATALSHRPFFWHEKLRRPLSHKVKQMFGDAAEFRIDGGFVVPIRWADGRVHAISSMGQKIDGRDPAFSFNVRLVCTSLLERLEACNAAAFIDGATPQLQRHTARYLQSMARGMAVPAISDKYNRPSHEVRAAIADACVALGVTSGQQAVIRARRYRLIDL